MEVELVTLGNTPLGVLPHELNDDDDDEETESNNAVQVSLCTTALMLAVIARNCRAKFYIHEDTDQQLLTYHTSFEGYLYTPTKDSTASRLWVTAVVVIPIAFIMRGQALQKASIVLVGYSDGYIRGYSKSGQLVLSKKLHLNPITKISFMSSCHSARLENVVVASESVVCIVEGWSLVQVIQNNVARMNDGSGWSEHDEDSVHLVFKKWNLKEQTTCLDIAVVGESTLSTYTYLCEASSVTGFEAHIRSGPVPEARIFSAGRHPMVALYKLSKDSGQVNVSEVVHAVASKMKNVVLGRISQAGGWLGWGNQFQQPIPKSKSMNERPSELPMELSIPDDRRCILSVTMSPLCNLAAMLDSFGRVMLLDCDNFTVRRMWKGYRHAQCGWVRVSDESTSKQTPTAQCLCIYGTRRGILEVWPTVYGKRLAVFHIGKGCKLMYLPNGVLTTPDLNEASSTLSIERVRNCMVVLSPLGSLLTVSVPSPCLKRLSDPVSCDTYLMKDFLKCVKLGNTRELMFIIAKIRTARFLKQAFDSLMRIQPQVTKQFLIDVINSILGTTNFSNCKALHQYLLGCRQIIRLKLGLETICSASGNCTKTNPGQGSLSMPHRLAAYTETLLKAYYKTRIVPACVVGNANLYDTVQSFKLPAEVGDQLLSQHTTENQAHHYSTPIPLLPKDASSNLLALGCGLFLPLLSLKEFTPDEDITAKFQDSGIPKVKLLNLLSQAFLSGGVTVHDVTAFHQRLCTIFTAVLRVKDDQDQQKLWHNVCRQCAITQNVGHAFSIVLLHQKLSHSEDRSSEEWETVTPEGGHWATLHRNLEILVHLHNIVGAEPLKRLPSIPFDDLPEDKDERSSYRLDPASIKFYDKAYKNSCFCAAALKYGGLSLVSHCLSEWIVNTDTTQLFPSGELDSLDPLFKLFPSALKEEDLFIHCAWHTAYVNDTYSLSLQYIYQISNQQSIAGLFGLLWFLKFEKTILRAIEDFRRGTALGNAEIELISVCRILFSCRLQHGEINKGDSINLQCSRINLTDIVDLFPCLHSTVVKNCLELLLLFEIALHFKGPPINLLSFFPNWFRKSLKKGLFKSTWQEQVPVQFHQKRLKLLMEAVSVCLETESPPEMFTAYTNKCVELNRYEDFVFLLGKYWKLDLDQLASHWAFSLFAGGQVDYGKAILLVIIDKSVVLSDLLSLAGHLTDYLLHNMERRNKKLALLAQTSPGLLEWMRKQSSNHKIKRCDKLQPSQNTLSRLITAIMPYLSEGAKDRAMQMDKLVQLM